MGRGTPSYQKKNIYSRNISYLYRRTRRRPSPWRQAAVDDEQDGDDVDVRCARGRRHKVAAKSRRVSGMAGTHYFLGRNREGTSPPRGVRVLWRRCLSVGRAPTPPRVISGFAALQRLLPQRSHGATRRPRDLGTLFWGGVDGEGVLRIAGCGGVWSLCNPQSVGTCCTSTQKWVFEWQADEYGWPTKTKAILVACVCVCLRVQVDSRRR